MSALGHHIERQGVATASISLIRVHTERIRPPRALWVPFDFGRPFGSPGNRGFQMGVLRSLLRLFECPRGPVLEDYPHDAPGAATTEEPWSCVLPRPPLAPATTESERLRQAILSEVAFLEPWYELRRSQTGRTSVGLSGLGTESLAEMVEFIAGYAAGEEPGPPAGVADPVPAALRLVADDLKAYYLEAAAAQPGGVEATATALNRWLYHETRFGDALYTIRDRFAASADPTAPPPALIPAVFRERPPRG